MQLVEFVLQRIAEDEDRHGHYKVQPSDYGDFDTPDGGCVPCDIRPPGRCRVLAECEAKRRIVEALARAGEGEYGGYGAAIEYAQEIVLGSLALPYADHEDFREAWNV